MDVRPRILVVDDDAELCELLGDLLGQEGFDVEAVNDGAEGLTRAAAGPHALVVLDVMLPKLSGFEVLTRLRQSSRVPVLMLTARGEDVDRIVGLEMGADDYLPKPFNPRELVARVRAIYRRATAAAAPSAPGTPLIAGDIAVSPAARRVLVGGEEVKLTTA
ncbi:MAG TPA: response regulator, partial [Polyangiaceae bacterium]|nr:response regulator [Polyangiaceae bacterium]